MPKWTCTQDLVLPENVSALSLKTRTFALLGVTTHKTNSSRRIGRPREGSHRLPQHPPQTTQRRDHTNRRHKTRPDKLSRTHSSVWRCCFKPQSNQLTAVLCSHTVGTMSCKRPQLHVLGSAATRAHLRPCVLPQTATGLGAVEVESLVEGGARWEFLHRREQETRFASNGALPPNDERKRVFGWVLTCVSQFVGKKGILSGRRMIFSPNFVSFRTA